MLKSPATEIQVNDAKKHKSSHESTSHSLFGSSSKKKLIPLQTSNLVADRLTSQYAWIKSNDPDVPELKKFSIPVDEQIVLLSSASFTAVEFACRIAVLHENRLTPKLILLDNGLEASRLWENITKFFNELKSEDAINEKVWDFVRQQLPLISMPDTSSDIKATFAREVADDMLEIIKKYGLELILNTIKDTIYIKQDWQCQQTFAEIKEFLDASDYKHVFVRASNIVVMSSVKEGHVILENIASLKPYLTLHSNINYGKGLPDKIILIEKDQTSYALQDLTRSIDPGHDHTEMYIIGMRFYRLNAKEYANFYLHEMHTDLAKTFAKNNYHPDLVNSSFFINALFKLAAIDLEVENSLFTAAEFSHKVAIHLPLAEEAIESIVLKLNAKFPDSYAEMSRLGQVGKVPYMKSNFVISVHALTQTIALQVKNYVVNNSDFRKKYEVDSPVRVISEFFSGAGMDTVNSDCFEETLCKMVTEKLHQQGIADITLETQRSSFAPLNSTHTQISLTLSPSAAQHVVNYFNRLEPNSAVQDSFVPYHQDIDRHSSVINVLNSTLMKPEFFEDLKAILDAYTPEQRNRYSCKPEVRNLRP